MVFSHLSEARFTSIIVIAVFLSELGSAVSRRFAMIRDEFRKLIDFSGIDKTGASRRSEFASVSVLS